MAIATVDGAQVVTTNAKLLTREVQILAVSRMFHRDFYRAVTSLELLKRHCIQM